MKGSDFLSETVRSVAETAASVRQRVETAAASDERVRRVLGVSEEVVMGTRVCDLCALPFIHGPALAPEIRKLQAAMDSCPNEGMLQAAHADLQRLDAAFNASALAADTNSSMKDACAAAALAVAETVRREATLDMRRAAEEGSAAECAQQTRDSFLRQVESIAVD